MIPQIDNMDYVTMEGIEVKTQPSYTYKMLIEDERIIGNTDGLEALKQAVYKRINTERDIYPIYTAYGVKKRDLFGKPKPYAFVVLKKRIEESLLEDDRIREVKDFVYHHEKSKGSDLLMSFTVLSTDAEEVEVEEVFNIG